MDNISISRIGGIAAILSIVLSVGAMAAPILLAPGSLLLIVFVIALHRLFNTRAGMLSLAAAVVAIAGAAVLMALTVASGSAGVPNNALSNLATWVAWFLPPLAFGYLGYRHPDAGFSRVLSIIGIVGGLFGLLNLIVVLIGGGSWAEPNDPALGPIIMITYYGGMLFTLAWMVWAGIVLLRLKPAAALSRA